MINFDFNAKCKIDYTNDFKKQLKKVTKQGRNMNLLREVIIKLANHESLDIKYQNHKLRDDNSYKECNECHITPNWVLVYKYKNNNLILLLVATGSHSEVLNK